MTPIPIPGGIRRRIPFFIPVLLSLWIGNFSLVAQEENLMLPDSVMQQDSVTHEAISTGWAYQAVTLGYISAPSVVGLMFISAVVNEWHAGIAGIPASALILMAPPLIFAGGRTVDIAHLISHPRAKLGWVLYAISLIPTSIALYGFTTDWGATLPLTISSGILGSAAIVAMTSYAFTRIETVHSMTGKSTQSFQFGITPLQGGALLTLALSF
jgi:hypothetical protein